MRRVARWIIGALPLDERGRRAMDETFADWEHESEAPSTGVSRWLRAAAGLSAVGRALVLLTLRDLVHLPLGWVLGRLVPLALVPAALVPLIFQSVKTSREPDWFYLTTLLPQVVAVVLPWAGLFAVATTNVRRSLPIMGLAFVVGLISFGLVGWLVPYGFQHYHRMFGQPLWGPVSSRSLSELTLPELWHGATTWAGNAQASAQWLLRRNLLLVATGPTLLLLASAYRALRPWLRLTAVAGTAMAYVLAMLWRHDAAGFLVATVILYFLVAKRLGATAHTVATG